MPPAEKSLFTPLQRIKVWYVLLLIVCGLFVIRLFYLQIIRHDHYAKAALSGQLKQYEIPAERGIIEAHNGSGTVPIVLNETKYTLYADPKFVENPAEAAGKLQSVIGGDGGQLEELMKADSRYVILAKKLDKNQKAAIDELQLKGIGTREAVYRTYPQGSLAAQALGFVNDEGQGTYGLEQALDGTLSGQPGQLKAITDANGVPLAANKDNVVVEPKPGSRVLMTIDVGMQQQLEEILKKGMKHAVAESGGAVIIAANTGKVKAMANYPTYNPAEFFKVSDAGVFQNHIVSSPMEVGSTMKPLTVAAAINEGVINKNSGYYDPGAFEIDGQTVTNVEGYNYAGNRDIKTILRDSLNTGATWVLMQLGGGQMNEKARSTWHDYLVNRYQFGKPTGIEQGYEAGGSVPSPTEGFGLNIQYANTAFGQGMSNTPLQLAAAISSIVNGGTYYRPFLVEKVTAADGNETVTEPQVVREGVVKESTSRDVRELMEYVFTNNHASYGMPLLRANYSIGGKTGTAEVPKPGGGYYTDRYNGTFMGFVGGNDIEYVIVVRVDTPKIAGYAGSKAAGPIFVDLANMLIDNFGVSPKK